MKVFIGWSGDRSKAMAQALHDWVPMVLHHVQPFLSEADIEAGKRWGDAIAKQLETTKFGIMCVTRENVSSPWVLFESGALAKSMDDSKVVPLLLDIEFKEISGPLAQFQAKKVDRSGISEVIHSVNRQMADSPVSEQRAQHMFDALWPELEKKLAAIPKQAAAPKHARSQPEILEELVGSVRALESRFRENMEESRFSRGRRRRFHPVVVDEMIKRLDLGRNDPTVLLIVASLFRDDAPWLYELGMEAYRTAMTGGSDEAERAFARFVKAADALRRTPLGEDIGFDIRAFDILLRGFEPPREQEPASKAVAAEAAPVSVLPAVVRKTATRVPRRRDGDGDKSAP